MYIYNLSNKKCVYIIKKRAYVYIHVCGSCLNKCISVALGPPNKNYWLRPCKYLSHSYYLELEPLFPRRHKEFQIAKFDFHRWTCWPYCCFYQRQGKVILKYFIFSWFESGKLSLYHNILCLVVCKCVYQLIIKKICVYQLFNNWLIITNSTIPIIMSFSFNILITSQVNIHYNYSYFEFKIDLSTYDLERFILAPQGFHKPKVVLWLQWGCYFVI